MEDRTSQMQEKFIIRLPDGMRDRIKQAAAQEGRSMNSQIVQHLRAIYQPKETEPENRCGRCDPQSERG